MKIGDVIAGRFVLERRAGAGGMGVVFRAQDTVSGAPAAIKLVVGSAAELERFAREVSLLAQLDHPRVVRYLAHGEAGEARYLAMEWLEGEDLAHRLTRGPLALADALAVLRGVAEALVALHAQGVVHRDIKPGNVFLPAGECTAIKLLDLGVARPRELAWNLTGTGVTIGTPAYMAPEQARGEPVDARADLFSLGCLIFECLSGRSPFHAEHPIAAFARMLVEDAPRLADIGVAAPPALEALLAAMLAKDPAARPVDARAVLLALDTWSGRLPSAHGPAPAITGAEQRIVTLVLTRPATDSSQTLLPQESGDLERRVRAIAATHRARLERLPNGSFLAFFSGAGAPTDHAAR
ncbi:MAG: serine/threonine protein kinase, partial [Myxococcales bacterium]|nr:serine/threonine protein kinase [Myxococcales bacterium]